MNIFEIFKNALKSDTIIKEHTEKTDFNIALGVLLWVVAEADKEFKPEEIAKIKEILQKQPDISSDDLDVIIPSIKKAADHRIDLHEFTNEVSKNISNDQKKDIIHSLFKIACADNELAYEEVEAIKKISNLFNINHRDFIAIKIKYMED